MRGTTSAELMLPREYTVGGGMVYAHPWESKQCHRFSKVFQGLKMEARSVWIQAWGAVRSWARGLGKSGQTEAGLLGRGLLGCDCLVRVVLRFGGPGGSSSCGRRTSTA